MPALRISQQEKFAQNIVSGMTQRAALKDAYPSSKKWKIESIDAKASALANTPEIKARIDELRQQVVMDAVMTAEQRMILLTDIAENPSEPAKSRMQAIEILNKMDGLYVKKVEAEVSTPVSEIADQVAEILDE